MYGGVVLVLEKCCMVGIVNICFGFSCSNFGWLLFFNKKFYQWLWAVITQSVYVQFRGNTYHWIRKVKGSPMVLILLNFDHWVGRYHHSKMVMKILKPVFIFLSNFELEYLHEFLLYSGEFYIFRFLRSWGVW